VQDVHPTATAGDGRRIRQGLQKPGDPDDNRLQCSQCGFFFNPDRDAEGDTGSDNESAGTITANTAITISNTAANLPVHLRDVATFLETSRTVKDPTHGSGCPFCNSLNPRGQFRNDRSFDTGVDLSGQ
jgi:hypothetical protein